jgi:hypothetical protein
MYRANKRTTFNIRTMRFETHTEVTDLTKTVPDQIKAQLEGKPKPLLAMCGQEILDEIIGKRK